ncbi:zona pellucida-binding protein 2 [Geothlypis trichas]
MAGGGGRPRCPPGVLLGVAAVVVAAGWVRAEQKEEQSIVLIGKNEVYGDIRHEVNVYVKVFTNSPFLVCMDLALSQERIIDPNYLWIGPDGRVLQGQSYVNLTETGKLMVMGFMVPMSGAYTCFLSHKVIETTTQEETEMVEAYKFMVYDSHPSHFLPAYREADHAYQVSVRFSTTGCRLRNNDLFIKILKRILNNSISHLTCHITVSPYKCHSIRTPKEQAYREADHAYQVSVRFSTTGCRLRNNDLFIKILKRILNNSISHLTCHITGSSYKCHSIRTPKDDLQYELFVNFLVNPFAPGWEKVCQEFPYDCEAVTNRRVRQAAERIGKFFHQLKHVLKSEFQAVPTIQYVDNSFSMTPIDSCRPGFGRNHHTHQNCASCCVVCGPGTYSPNHEVTCQTCARPEASMYGAKSCH